MLQISQTNKERVLSSIYQGRIDAADISQPNFIDEIIIEMHSLGVLDELTHVLEDKRKVNATIPLKFIWILGIAAKMKIRTSLTDIPYAVMDAEVLSKLGYSLWDTERDIAKGLLDEGAIRHLLGKYEKQELITGYNKCVQEHILPLRDIRPNLHILDCTELEVELSNSRYEDSCVIKKDGKSRRGYKLATIRGIVDSNGIIEDIRFGAISTHDMELSREMILSSPVLNPGDALINDRGFLSRDVLNELKARRSVDTYIPIRKNMNAYEEAVSIAKTANQWKPHPNKKRKTQKIAFVSDLGSMWVSGQPENDVPLNACVVWDKKDDEYYVFVTTDTRKTAKQIIQTYELRPEIEEDYRQLKDFWALEDFKSTKINVIAFHIVCTLLGYLLFQLYVLTEDGSRWVGKSLPVIIKKYIPPVKPKSVIVYSGQYFAVFHFVEFLHIYTELNGNIRAKLDSVLALV